MDFFLFLFKFYNYFNSTSLSSLLFSNNSFKYLLAYYNPSFEPTPFNSVYFDIDTSRRIPFFSIFGYTKLEINDAALSNWDKTVKV